MIGGKPSSKKVQNVQAVQPLRSVQTGLNGLNQAVALDEKEMSRQNRNRKAANG
jgi:hypothetical protein